MQVYVVWNDGFMDPAFNSVEGVYTDATAAIGSVLRQFQDEREAYPEWTFPEMTVSPEGADFRVEFDRGDWRTVVERREVHGAR